MPKDGMFFIAGQFWQRNYESRLTVHPDRGSSVVPNTGELEALFTGFIGEKEMEQGVDHVTCGFMNDVFGQSEITDFIKTPNTLTFKKRYINQTTVVTYNLTSEINGEDTLEETTHYAGDWFAGNESVTVAQGKARCILVLVPAFLFRKPK